MDPNVALDQINKSLAALLPGSTEELSPRDGELLVLVCIRLYTAERSAM